MGNGHNEPVKFTRGDAERLRAIEIQHGESHSKIKEIAGKIDTFLTVHDKRHTATDKEVANNTRFRKNAVRVLLWIFTTSSGVGLLAATAKAMGWLN